MIGYCAQFRGALIFAILGSLVVAVLAAIAPLLVGRVIDDAVLSDRSALAPWLIALVGLAVVRGFFAFVRRYYAGRMSYGVDYRLRTQMFESLQRLDGSQQDRLRTGQVVSRATSDVSLVERLISSAPLTLASALQFLLSLVLMALLSPVLTLVALTIAPIIFLVTRSGSRRFFPATWEESQRRGELAGVVEAAVTGVRVVKGFGQEEREQQRLENRAGVLYGAMMRVNDLVALYMPLFRAIPAIGQVGVLGLGGWLALTDQITLGTFVAFTTYLAQMTGPMMMLAGQITQLQTTKAAIVRIFEVIDAEPTLTDRAGARDAPEHAAPIELDGVTFGYGAGPPVLSDVSLRVAPGETLALVGGSGSGKSTVALLLARFYDPESGAVRLDGVDLRDLTMTSLRRRIGMVFEDSFLFSDTVRANIAFGRPNATDQDVRAAASAAEADRFIRELDDGYDTVVGERGLTLSGGQRQRIALARALLTSPHVLILDDATSAVDAGVEAEIQATLRQVMRGRTTLLIAHRRSTLQLADRIGVLHRGELVDVGTHEELFARCARYRLLLTGHDAAELDGTGPSPDSGERSVLGVGNDPATTASTATTATTASTVSTVPVSPGGGADVEAGITPELWSNPPARDAAGTGALGDVTLSAEAAAKVAELAPVSEDPEVDLDQARQPDHRFGLGALWRPFRSGILIGIGLFVLGALGELVLPLLTRAAVDDGVIPGDAGMLLAVSGSALSLVAVMFLVNRWQARVVGRTGNRLLYWLRVKLSAQLQRLGMDFYERERGGQVMTRMTTDVDSVTRFIQGSLGQLCTATLMFCGVLGVMFVMSVPLTLATLTLVPAFVVAVLIYRHHSVRAYDAAREQLSVVNSNFQENIAGIRVAQAYGREVRNIEIFGELATEHYLRQMRAQRYLALFFSFVEAATELASVIVLGVGAGLVASGGITTGGIIAFMLYLTMLFSPIQQFSQVLDGYLRAKVGLARIRELLRTRTSIPPPPDPRPVERLSGEIAFDDVSFAYDGAEEPALRSLGLLIEPGETVAVVGETGAGKSTLMKLVARFYDPTDGVVRVDQHDLRTLDLAAYRHRLGFVPQEAYLFEGSVRDAIAYGRPDATEPEVELAARAVGAHDMIAGLPHGYHHPVGERGRGLSAGQRQLLALARAQLVHPDILLLDEATAALDLATEAAVTAGTERLSRSRTTMVIAHRLTTAQHADRILVVDHGEVVEVGSHDELVNAGGAYAALWKAFVGTTDGAGR